MALYGAALTSDRMLASEPEPDCSEAPREIEIIMGGAEVKVRERGETARDARHRRRSARKERRRLRRE